MLACSEEASPRSSPNGVNIFTDEAVLERFDRLFVNARCLCSVSEEMGKPGSDAGMPGIEDSEVGKIDEAQFGNADCQKLVFILQKQSAPSETRPSETLVVVNVN